MPSPVHEYVVGFRVFEGKSLQTEDGGPCDPFVMVECCDCEFRTATMENKVTKSLVQWNEGYIWPDIRLLPKQFDSATIDFSVYSRYWFGRNFLIGKATMQLSFVNSRPRHLYARTWLQLKREEAGPECTGELQVSVYALKPGQQAPSATEQNEASQDHAGEAQGDEEMDELSKHVLKATPEVNLGRQYHLRIIVARVEDLRDLPFGGGPPSPYVTVEFAGFLVQIARGECVNMFTFNEEIVIPVTSPIYEDLIVIKLWTGGSLFMADELVAQGNISFRGLRNESMAPRWFNFYGWNLEEIPDPGAIIESGAQLKPNYFKGRLLLAGQVELLRDGEDLQRAAHLPSRPVPDPEIIQLALLADVYMVTGAEGVRCRVEVSFGATDKTTGMVDYDAQSIASKMDEAEEERQRVKKIVHPDPDAEEEEEEKAPETIEQVNSFTFNESDGRIDPILAMTPDDPASQPKVLINVYTEGRLFSERRIGYAMCDLGQFPMYDHGCPAKPHFLALEPMPDVTMNRTAPSVLISIERHTSDDVERHSRKSIKPMAYIVRSYCFLARRIENESMAQVAEPSSFALRISCAGMSRTSEMLQGPRPMWMQHMDMRVILCSDSIQETPTIEPITVTLVEEGSLVSSDLGQAVCIYTHLRKRDNLGRWDPYKLEPQWIQIMDPTNATRPVGEVLIAFELFLWKYREENSLQPRNMWPQLEASFDPREHFCRLKKATLHFSLHGLRDVVQLPNVQSLGFIGGYRHVDRPMVTVEVNRFFKPEQDSLDVKTLAFQYRDVLPGCDKKIQSQCLQRWRSRTGLDREGGNFEFFQVGQMPVLIPDKMLLQPYVSIKVLEEPAEDLGIVGQALGYGGPTPIGESLQSLADHLPCCWLEDVELDKPYNEQRALIRQRLEEAKAEAKVRSCFQEPTEAELKEQAEADGTNAAVSLKVRIFSAVGIGCADVASPFCTCEIRGKSGTRIRTRVGTGEDTVEWDHKGIIANYTAGDTLFFRVRDKDKPAVESVVGSASLASDRFYPNGFEDSLQLKGPTGGRMLLRVKVGLLTRDEARKRSRWGTMAYEEVEEPADSVNTEAVPACLRRPGLEKRPLLLGPMEEMNMKAVEPFSPRRGAAARGEEHGRKILHGKLENSRDKKTFVHDFWYKAMPLLRNHDIVSPDDHELDWNFQPDRTFGFVKCAFKLTDGWDMADQEAVPKGLEKGMTRCMSFGEEVTKKLSKASKVSKVIAELQDEPVEDDRTRLSRSFDLDKELDRYAFDEALLEEKFKGNAVPSRVRVRLYLVKAVCVFGKAAGFADPYIEFQLGRYINVSMKNMMKSQTNTPEFYHIEERDIQLPVDGRLEVRVMDYDDMQSSLIGSTVIDLEDRWHSTAWNKANSVQQTPMENRPLFTPEYPGKNRGSLEMWIEMVESTRAGEVQAADIRKPAEIEVEVRFVLWGTGGVKAFKDGYTNVKLSTKLDCKEYGGEHPEFQETDIHYNSRDGKAVFNWRVVYPRIQMPTVACSVQFCLYHAETFGDEPIGMLDFNLQDYLQGVAKDLTARVVGPGDVTFQSIDTDDEDVGSVSITLYVMTQSEATSKRQGLGQSDPNDDPQLLTPIEGREWGEYLATFGFAWPDFGLWKKVLPLVITAIAFLFSLVVLRQAGLL